MPPSMWLIMGCTATGKGKLAFELARRLNGEILSIDSMKVYQRMDIGTAKPDSAVRERIPHHLIDVVEPCESFSLGRFIELADDIISQLQGRQRPIIAVGGTAMYIRGLLYGIFDGPAAQPDIRKKLEDQARQEGSSVLHRRLESLDPAAARKIHPNDLKRIIRALEVYELTGKCISSFQQQFGRGGHRHNWALIEVRRPRQENHARINHRVKEMIAAGLVDEVSALLAEPKGLSPQAAQAVGYAEIIAHLHGRYSLNQAIEQIKVKTRRFAKSQRTWFRSFNQVHRFDLADDESPDRAAEKLLNLTQLEPPS